MPGWDFRYTFGESMGRTDMTARMGLIAAGGLLLAFAVIQLLGLPGPPA